MSDIYFDDTRPVYHFDGDSQHAYCLHNSVIDAERDAITVEARIKPDTVAVEFQEVIDRYGCFELTTCTWYYNRPALILNIASGDRYVHASESLSTSEYSHLVGTYDSAEGERTLRIYINGVLKGSTPLSGLASYGLPGNPFNCRLQVACYGCSGPSSAYYDGVIDYIRWYSVKLTELEIQKNMEGVYAKRGLLSYWRFNEGTGTKIWDSHGGNHLTLYTL